MRRFRLLLGLLALCGLFGAARPAAAAEVSLFNGLPYAVDVVRLLPDGGEHRPWSGPMEPGSRWRLRMPAGTRIEFRRAGRAVARLELGPQARQGHVIRLPGLLGPVPPPPPPGQPSEFPDWERGSAVRPVTETASKGSGVTSGYGAWGGGQ